MFKKLFQYLREIKVELKDKTTWPSRDEVLNLTVVVVSSLVIVSLLLYGVDYVVSYTLRYAVVDKVALIKPFVNEFSFLIFIVLLFFYYRLRARISKK